MADRRKEKRTSRLSVLLSLLFHGILVGALVFFAAREGILGKELKKIAVTMVPREKPPEEKPKEKEPTPKPTVEEPKPEEPRVVPAAQPEIPPPVATAPPPAGNLAAPAAAPAAATLPAFDFEGGKTVETVSDPNVIYRGYVEYTLRSRWIRPDGVADEHFVAEVQLTLAPDGRIQSSTWKKGSGHQAWDNSVKRVLAETATIGRPPPKGFPDQVVVRFDVQVATEVSLE